VLFGITLGTALSAVLAEPAVALASAVAFVLAELLDLAVYVPLRERGFAVAAIASSVAGLVLDSVVFLFVAFGSMAFLPGQVVGKATAVLLSVAVINLLRASWRRWHGAYPGPRGQSEVVSAV
jgi:uncharacterized PurR-regulated membrane protein YhhQ (DUF165 family)